MQKLYKDRDWLYIMYRIKRISISQIAEEMGISRTPMHNWFHKLNIPIRSRAERTHLVEANHCNLSQEAREWIDGELLGDGCLCSRSSYSARISYGSKYPEYIQYVLDTLKSFGIEQSGRIKKYYNKKGNCYTYNYASRAYVELLPVRKRWYPEGKKIVPKDLELTPLILRQHYIGDGSLIHRKGKKPRIILATCSFPISDVEWLINKLNKLGFKATRQNFNNMISISTYSTQEFLDYIGKCPVKCYQYKWNY